MAEKSLTILELSADNTSDQKSSSISGKSSDDSIFMHILLLLVSISPVIKEEVSLEHCCGEIGLCSSVWSDPAARFDESTNSWSVFNSWSNIEISTDLPLISGVTWFFLSLFFKCVCQTFLISLSVRPGNLAAIADHLNIKKRKENHVKICTNLYFDPLWFAEFKMLNDLLACIMSHEWLLLCPLTKVCQSCLRVLQLEKSVFFFYLHTLMETARNLFRHTCLWYNHEKKMTCWSITWGKNTLKWQVDLFFLFFFFLVFFFYDVGWQLKWQVI